MIHPLIVVVMLHGGPADHVSKFIPKMEKAGYKVQVCAAGPALKTLQDRNISITFPFTADNLSTEQEAALAQQIGKICEKANCIITDVGHPFDITLQKHLFSTLAEIKRFAYVDNAESYVPGGYSDTANKVMEFATKTLFANANLTDDPKISLPLEKRLPIGYYPVAQAEKISALRASSHTAERSSFLQELSIEDTGQKVAVFCGGNNEEYFSEAFPAFLEFLEETISKQDLSDHIFVLQQHPGAKANNRDGILLSKWISKYGSITNAPKIFISSKTTETILVIADGVLYHQTSMGPLFALAGIPMIQVGRRPYEDIVIKENLCPSATNSASFAKALSSMESISITEEKKIEIYQKLGIREDWAQNLKRALAS